MDAGKAAHPDLGHSHVSLYFSRTPVSLKTEALWARAAWELQGAWAFLYETGPLATAQVCSLLIPPWPFTGGLINSIQKPQDSLQGERLCWPTAWPLGTFLPNPPHLGFHTPTQEEAGSVGQSRTPPTCLIGSGMSSDP